MRVAFLLAVLMLVASVAEAQTRCRNGYCGAPVAWRTYSRSAATTTTTTTTQQFSSAQTTFYGDSAGDFLALLNAERARYGRRPLVWDGTLAAYAARNTGIHAVRAPGSSQCWAGTRSYRHAFSMWMRSPSHRAILLNASYSVGCSTCPSGVTANAR